jgi:hypothetical protein
MICARVAAHFPVEFARINFNAGRAPPFSKAELQIQFRPEIFRFRHLALLPPSI